MPLKACVHSHCFTVLIYLATWRAAKLGIFSHFMFANLPWCSQSMNSLIYILYTDPQLLFMSAWSQSWSHFILVLPKKISVLPPDNISKVQNMFKVNNRSTKHDSGVFIVTFEYIWHIVLVFFCWLWLCKWHMEYLLPQINLSMHFRVGSRNLS